MRQSFLVTKADRGKRLDVYLSEQLPQLSRSHIQQLLRSGKAGADDIAQKQALKTGSRLHGGERLWVELSPAAPLRADPEPIPLTILYEDEDVVAVDKPAGMVVHIGAGVRSGTLVNALLFHFQNLSRVGGDLRPGIVHRLDKNTSGAILIAKNDFAHRQLASQFAARTIEKFYLALVHGSVEQPEGTVSLAIRRDPVRRVRMMARPPGVSTRRGQDVGLRKSATDLEASKPGPNFPSRGRRERAALSRYRVLRKFSGFTLLEVQIFTGRTHQVRVHLASVGHPVMGDMLYGAPAKLPAALIERSTEIEARSQKSEVRSRQHGAVVPTLNRHFLHAAWIRFRHPRTGNMVEVRSPLPRELEEFLSRLEPLESLTSATPHSPSVSAAKP